MLNFSFGVDQYVINVNSHTGCTPWPLSLEDTRGGLGLQGEQHLLKGQWHNPMVSVEVAWMLMLC